MSQDNNLYNPAVVYTIDSEDRIININDSWDDFAFNNDAKDLKLNKVLNTLLWDHVSDLETRHINITLANKVRDRQEILILPFRCDSPSVRRYMKMKIMPGDDRSVTYLCTVEKIVQRAPILFTEQKEWRNHDLMRMCSWCKKVYVEDEGWYEIEDAVYKLKLFDRRALPGLSHTICESCLEKLSD